MCGDSHMLNGSDAVGAMSLAGGGARRSQKVAASSPAASGRPVSALLSSPVLSRLPLVACLTPPSWERPIMQHAAPVPHGESQSWSSIACPLLCSSGRTHRHARQCLISPCPAGAFSHSRRRLRRPRSRSSWCRPAARSLRHHPRLHRRRRRRRCGEVQPCGVLEGSGRPCLRLWSSIRACPDTCVWLAVLLCP